MALEGQVGDGIGAALAADLLISAGAQTGGNKSSLSRFRGFNQLTSFKSPSKDEIQESTARLAAAKEISMDVGVANRQSKMQNCPIFDNASCFQLILVAY